MPNRELADIRNNYHQSTLDWNDLPDEPLQALNEWLKEAISANLYEPTAMTLATVDEAGKPHARIVLLKGVDNGLLFYSNYLSPKGKDLLNNHHAAIVLFWPELERQIRVEGKISLIDEAASNEYFYSRPLDSQIAASISRQSQVIASREVLDQAFDEAKMMSTQTPIQRPKNWGGYRLIPNHFEFWQGRPNRLHDRLCWQWSGDDWIKSRLAP